VPIAAGGGGGTETSAVTGYNTAQYIAIQVGKWGSGLAGNVWKTFLTALDSNKMAGICPSDDDAALPTPSCIKVTAQSLDTVTTLMAMDACTKIINKYAKESHATTGFSSDNWDALGGEDVVIVETTWGGIRPFSGREWDKHFEPGIKYGMDLVTDRKALSSSLREYSYKDLCGSYSIPLARGLYAGVYETQRDAFYKLTKYVDTAVGEVYDRGSLVNSGIRAGGGYQDARKKAYVDAIQRLALDFQGVFKRGAEEEIGLVDEHLAGNPAYNMGPKGRYQVTGWLSAAAWFPQITAIVGARSAALEGSLPHTTMPTLVEGGSTGFTVIGGNGTAAHSLDAASADYTRFMSVLRDAAEQVGVNANKLTSASSEMKEFASGDISTERVTGWFSGSILAGVLKTVDYIMSLVGLTEPDGALAVRFGKGMNPLLEISALGHKFIRVGASAVEIGATAIMADKILDAVTSKIPGLGKLASALLKAVGSAAGFIGTCLLVVAPIFFMVGVMLGFIVPLYPFYRFFFGAVKWIMTLFEAVIMAPLFALAHVNPYGEGLAGQYGKYGYSVAMQLLLRPVLMVFGLIAGYLLFTATLHFLNDAFYFATSATLAQDSIISVLAKLVYSIIYAALVIILANQCFRTIGLFPDVALSWLGMQGIKEEQIGDHQMLAAAGGWLARGGMDGLSKAVRGGAGALGTGIGKMIPDKTSGAGVSRGVGGPMGTAYALPKSTQTPSPSASPAGGGYFSNFGNMGGTPGNLYAGGTGAYGQGNTNVSGTQASTATAQTTSQSPPASGYDSGLAGRLAQMGDIGDNHTASSGDAQTPDPDKSSAKDQDKSLLGQIKDKPPESGGDGGTFV
ncbi:MAG: DotA/TraY family protein, partial [Alphaproteobacteria bacterium]|nr:DotA/TraY family protein [Alphaproteobacteria bacterium]